MNSNIHCYSDDFSVFRASSSFNNVSGSLKPQDHKMGGILDNFDAAALWLIRVLSPPLPASFVVTVNDHKYPCITSCSKERPEPGLA